MEHRRDPAPPARASSRTTRARTRSTSDARPYRALSRAALPRQGTGRASGLTGSVAQCASVQCPRAPASGASHAVDNHAGGLSAELLEPLLRQQVRLGVARYVGLLDALVRVA